MRINSIQFKDKQRGWELEELKFDDLNLLVGISGAGKTQILNAILAIKNILDENLTSGINWKIDFIEGNDNYIWEGELSELEDDDTSLFPYITHSEIIKKIKFIFEKLYLNGDLIVDRTEEKIIYNNNPLPKLDTNTSILKLLEEDNLKNVVKAFDKIIFRDYTKNENQLQISSKDYYIDWKIKFNSIEKLKIENIPLIPKIYITSKLFIDIFNEIKSNFLDIFSQVENIEVVKEIKNIGKNLLNCYYLKIKIKDSDKWVNQNNISSGMLRTLIHIAEMYLSPDGTVFLIDELENSLGINCVNFLSEDLLLQNNRMQFIATSHHPYIINKIPCEYWKIVTRKGGKIKVYDTTQFNLDKSHHENFFKLINLKEYREGIQ
ncbi:MAG: hypothetical protein A2086_15830 [Spirochaetes bacterium GWD1_27_9]|nr:MAG: hypothetical protein A2Z98_11100 [Spirochaetes bacterium GWB1_27_13]OHD27084.1 MAG: hypothetical protein A2Y34_11340 [Spirochaetes bacterium GWC1_27_15]OHD42849.1 MAG: hypothetical protein A2086_15830 [Spirochaetes bacterium GWD1_27_9]